METLAVVSTTLVILKNEILATFLKAKKGNFSYMKCLTNRTKKNTLTNYFPGVYPLIKIRWILYKEKAPSQFVPDF